jgi:hypothetical protein
MKTIYTFALLTIVSFSARAQLISQFTWEGASATTAAYGPNATSISSSALIGTDGANGTHGLNPGAGSHDINMILPGSYFTISSLDISVDFRRKESDASFFNLGSFDLGMNAGSLHAKFLLSRNSHDTAINLSGLYNIPSDNAFHTYHFIYNASTGLATVAVDGTTVGSYQAPAATALSWTGAGNVTVGQIMDGTGSNVSVLDNLIVKNPIGFSTLPLDLLSYDAVRTGAANELTWKTTHEIEVREFVVERSVDGVNYTAIGSVAAHQEYMAVEDYRFEDGLPAAVNYYRLKITNLDGSYGYSPVKKIGNAVSAVIVSCYPNPVVNYVNVKVSGMESATYMIATMDGKILQSGVIVGGQASLNVSGAPKGLLIVRVGNERDGSAETFKVFKQ